MNPRQTQIVELLSTYKKMDVTELSERLSVSQVTIRKDLIQLENNGLVIREHGYATLNDSDDINHRLGKHFERKQRIAKACVSLVNDGETIMIESGSCCALTAMEIVKAKKDITIITNSAFIADYVRKAGNPKIILLGGDYQLSSQVMVGPLVRQCVSSFFVDKLFIGTDGLSKNAGFTGNDYMRSEAVRDMANQANKVIIVTDSTKFGKTGTVNLLPINKIYGVVTDTEIPEEFETYLNEKEVVLYKA